MRNETNLLGLIVICLVLTACWRSASIKELPNGSGKTLPSPNLSPATDENKYGNKKNNGKNNNQVSETSDNQTRGGGFLGNLPVGFQMPDDEVGKRMLREYGAMFVAKGVTPPKVVIFKNESEVSAFQAGLQKATENIGGITIELQASAMSALKKAIEEARSKNLSITPNNADSARRTYQQTVTNWKSRVEPGLRYWVSKGKLSPSEAGRIRSLSPSGQVPEIFRLESQGMFFSKDLSKTIIYSVAPPGASQHISMLALDVKEHDNVRVREILAKYGWFQTVVSDLPHFTYLGVTESELSGLGLKKVSDGGRTFWIPNL
jgi:hypothetical protein